MHPRKKGQYMGSQSNREHYTSKEPRSPGELEYRNQGLGKGGNCHTRFRAYQPVLRISVFILKDQAR